MLDGRLGAEVGEDVAHVEVEVDHGRVLAGDLRDRAGEVRREERLAGPALGREDRHDPALLRLEALRPGDADRAQVRGPHDRAFDGVAELLGALRHVDDVADAGPHRGGQQAVPRVVADQHDGRARCLAAHELSESERVGLLHLGREHQHLDRVEGVDQELFGRGGGLNPAHFLGLDLQRTSQLLAEGLRRPDGDDAGLIHDF